ncbi:MAG: diguanylate cyclase [Deltaproteobacteria bacterium]|nr:diguanylate cyclase [Deltaproteobacteria bacterium]
MFTIVLFIGLVAVHNVYKTESDVFWSSPLALLATSTGLMTFMTLLLVSIRRTGERLEKSEELFRVVFENTAVGLVHIRRDGKMLHANEAFGRFLGYTPDEVMDESFRFEDIFYSETAKARLFGDADFEYSSDNRYVLIEPCRGKDEKLAWLDLYVERITGTSGNMDSYIIAIVDVTRQRRVAAELAAYRENLEKIVDERTARLKESEERFRFIAEHNADVIWMMDLKNQRLTYVSPSVQQLLGISVNEVMTQSPWEVFTPDSKAVLHARLEEVLAKWSTRSPKEELDVIEARQTHKDGHTIDVELIVSLHPDEKGRPGFLLGVTHDITARKRAEEELRRMAFYDGLTKLPNRRLLYDRLQLAVRHARRKKRRIALLFIDLDNFKPVNDKMGHQVGDWLLREASVRMEENLRSYDTAARMGGDEFIVLLPDLENVGDALATAERIRLAIERPFVTEDNTALSLSCSIGVALFPDHADNEHDLMRIGDDAMYKAKRAGRNRVEMLAFPSVPIGNAWVWREHDAPLRLSWSTVFECGDATLDAEHQNLFELANQVISTAMVQEKAPEQFIAALECLLAEIKDHFGHEEKILQQIGWPDLSAHQLKHRELIARAGELRKAAEENQLPIRNLVDFLAVEMVVQHILTDDKKYFASLATPPPTLNLDA